MSLNFFDKIIYINLKHRKDKKESILKEFEKLKIEPKKIYRLNAHFNLLNGHKGCATSHIKALNFAIKNKFKNVLILEDDCIFCKKIEKVNHYVKNFMEKFKNNWDIFFLGANVKFYENTKYKSIKKIISAQCAHAYAINNHYFLTLKKCFEKSLKIMKNDIFMIESYGKAIDQMWKQLQSKDRWYIGEEFIVQQGNFFSDIELTLRERKHYFKKKIL